jgi:hypothetical protein
LYLIRDFHPMLPTRHSEECFRVQEQKFCYGNNIISPGFSHGAAYGGSISTCLPVPIVYIGNDILRLDIDANFPNAVPSR